MPETRPRISGPTFDRRASARGSACAADRGHAPRSPLPRSRRSSATTSRGCPAASSRRAFVRAYAQEVGLDPEDTVRRFVARFPDESGAEESPAPTSRTRTTSRWTSRRRSVARGAPSRGALPLLLVVAYFGFGGRVPWWGDRAAPSRPRTSWTPPPSSASSRAGVPAGRQAGDVACDNAPAARTTRRRRASAGRATAGGCRRPVPRGRNRARHRRPRSQAPAGRHPGPAPPDGVLSADACAPRGVLGVGPVRRRERLLRPDARRASARS